VRILIHSNAPWLPAGYSQQTALLAPRLAGLGHQVAISAFCGISATVMDWRGIRVYPAGAEPYGADVLPGHAGSWQADLVLTLMDAWVLPGRMLASLPKTACWMPVDCSPLSLPDRQVLEASGAVPVAMSEFGRAQLAAAGFDPLLVPHAIDTSVFCPGDKTAAREMAGLPQDAFVIGINAQNLDAVRKGWPEQMTAFAMFRKKHPDAILLAHTQPGGFGAGADLREMAERLCISDAIRWTDWYRYVTGGNTPEEMAWWYRCLDLYSGCSYAEGFGLPLLEAAACGIPAVATDFSAMPETAAPGSLLVPGDPFYNPRHRSFWLKPNIGAISAAYERAYSSEPDREMLRDHALRFDTDRVMVEFWKPCLEALAL
jgi:glycosyltransferase involved in cell wall biosynthesis